MVTRSEDSLTRFQDQGPSVCKDLGDINRHDSDHMRSTDLLLLAIFKDVERNVKCLSD